MARFPKPRKFIPKNKDKYAGNIDLIISRSNWETQTMIWLDEHSGVTKWSSEEVVIPYFSPVDGKPHRYFPDFKVHVKNEGIEQVYLVEVKPKAQTRPPKMRKRLGHPTTRYVSEAKTYVINECKFRAATKYCESRGWKFLILTEDNIKKI